MSNEDTYTLARPSTISISEESPPFQIGNKLAMIDGRGSEATFVCIEIVASDEHRVATPTSEREFSQAARDQLNEALKRMSDTLLDISKFGERSFDIGEVIAQRKHELERMAKKSKPLDRASADRLAVERHDDSDVVDYSLTPVADRMAPEDRAEWAKLLNAHNSANAAAQETPSEFVQRLCHRGLAAELCDSADVLKVTGDVTAFINATAKAISTFNSGIRHLDPNGADPR